jgi:3-oxoacid CoA-transferase subunit A
MGNVYITGDKHGNFNEIFNFCKENNTSCEDIIIILGDACINYNNQSTSLKEKLSKIPITLFCIHGNHENRPQNIPTYKEKIWNGGVVFIEDEYSNILFAKDGEVFNIADKKCIVIGGAYSVDKFIRLERGFNWWADEQPSDEIKVLVEKKIERINNNIDVVLSHTSPLKYEPIEVFLSFIDQSTVDKSTEEWLDKIEEQITYKKWYCGHYHTEKTIDRMRFMFTDIEEFKV